MSEAAGKLSARHQATDRLRQADEIRILRPPKHWRLQAHQLSQTDMSGELKVLLYFESSFMCIVVCYSAGGNESATRGLGHSGGREVPIFSLIPYFRTAPAVCQWRDPGK